MLLTRIVPRRFSSRLFLMTLFTGLIPVIIFTFLIQTSGDRFKNEINQTVESGRDQEWGRSEALLRLQGEEQIRAKAADVAVQLNLVLRSVPWMTLQDLQRDRQVPRSRCPARRADRVYYPLRNKDWNQPFPQGPKVREREPPPVLRRSPRILGNSEEKPQG